MRGGGEKIRRREKGKGEERVYQSLRCEEILSAHKEGKVGRRGKKKSV